MKKNSFWENSLKYVLYKGWLIDWYFYLYLSNYSWKVTALTVLPCFTSLLNSLIDVCAPTSYCQFILVPWFSILENLANMQANLVCQSVCLWWSLLRHAHVEACFNFQGKSTLSKSQHQEYPHRGEDGIEFKMFAVWCQCRSFIYLAMALGCTSV